MNPYASRQYTEITDIRDRKKIELLDNTIPEDVLTIIDIGCGNGLITNHLNQNYDILGVDINASKLQYVEGPSLLSGCDSIDRPDRSFDMVFSSEMLEHLPDNLYHSTLSEFERLAAKYILITVPYRESLDKLMVKCGKCHRNYHKNGHLRSFTETSFLEVFSNFDCVKSITYGNPVRSYPSWLASIKHTVVPSSSWIPAHWIKTMGVPYNFCIHCGHRNELTPGKNPAGFFLDGVNTLISPKYKSHLLVLFKRKDWE